jgi:hypothetical protein
MRKDTQIINYEYIKKEEYISVGRERRNLRQER